MNFRGLSAAILIVLAFSLGWQHYRDWAVRSRVAGVWLDHRRLSQALVDYQLEHGDYPPTLPGALAMLTTPVAYARLLPRDPFLRAGDGLYRYRNETENDALGRAPWVQFSLAGVGPDGGWSPGDPPLTYDPSNGILSAGDICTPGPADVTYPRAIWRAPMTLPPARTETAERKE